MGWFDGHLHEFNIQGTSYAVPDPDFDFDDSRIEDEKKFSLKDFSLKKGDKFSYTYDFGDDWEHLIKVKDVIPKGSTDKLYQITGGKRATPPEDCGGSPGYENFLEAINNEDHEEHKHYMEWAGGEFDPEEYPIEGFNDMLEEEFLI